jgi:predicted phosphodiesterase
MGTAHDQPDQSSGEPVSEPMRYAHPYYTSIPLQERPALPLYGRRALDWSDERLGPIPAPRGDAVMRLADVIGAAGAAEIAQQGAIRFHAVGDTGRHGGNHDDQEHVAARMAEDYHPDGGGGNPAFFLHLGDIIYGPGKERMYRDELYRPYMRYPGKILAVPGNHDGEVFNETDPEPLQAFLDNFCQPTPTVPAVSQAVGILREMVAQPGVYWRLDTPVVDIIGLYSNILEGPGALGGQGSEGQTDSSQRDWLRRTLTTIRGEREAADTKALVFAVHHPPFSHGGHHNSAQMLADIDTVCEQAGVYYDAVLSGHSHNYQRFTRRMTVQGEPREAPFVVAGCGGHGLSPVHERHDAKDDLHDRDRDGGDSDHTLEQSGAEYGYLLVTVSRTRLTIDMWRAGSHHHPFDTVTLDLQTHQLR